MSLNRYEETLFAYWEKQPDERRHWQAKVMDLACGASQPGEAARDLERELWAHFVERGPHVPALRDLGAMGLRRVSLLNLAEHIIRLWGAAAETKEARRALALRASALPEVFTILQLLYLQTRQEDACVVHKLSTRWKTPLARFKIHRSIT